MKQLLVAAGIAALIVGACGSSTPTAPDTVQVSNPTPKIVYVTPAPTQDARAEATPTVAPTPDPTPDPTDPPTPAPPPPPKSVSIAGTCDSCNSKRFTLPAGDWDVLITGFSKHDYILGSDFGGGNVIMDLNGGENGDYEPLVNEIVKGGKHYRYRTSVYGLSGGRYYVDVIAPDRGWKVTFTWAGEGDSSDGTDNG